MGRSRSRASRGAASREAEVPTAGESVPPGAPGDAAAPAPPPSPPYEFVSVGASVRSGWYILRWRNAGEEEVIRTNVNWEFLKHKARKTGNPVLRQLYEWQMSCLDKHAVESVS